MSTKKNINDSPLVLTRAEEEVMQILWKIEKGMVHDLLEKFPEPKPAYNTVSTIVRILEQKGFVGHKAYGRTHEYCPVISKSDYTKSYFRNFVTNYFGNSYKSLASFFANEGKLSMKELEEIRKTIHEEIRKQKGGKQ
ncbi:MAG TPA: BlaI/MecI/CopY family transcriptional regulator [Bacteroidales bacterium]|nr:BlaI/MecI/CopY family transcriptional regulator [Bacteroidales bacterium]